VLCSPVLVGGLLCELLLILRFKKGKIVTVLASAIGLNDNFHVKEFLLWRKSPTGWIINLVVTENRRRMLAGRRGLRAGGGHDIGREYYS